MSALAARAGVVVRDVPATLTALVFAGWAFVAVLGWYGLAPVPRPGLLLSGLVVAAVLRLVFTQRPLPALQQTVVILALVAAAAAYAATLIEGRAYSLVAIAGALAAGWFFRRRVTLAVAIMFLLAGFYATIQAVFDIDPYKPHDAVLGGLIVATLFAYVSNGRERRAVPIAGAILFAVYVAITRVYAEVADVPAIGDEAFYVFGWYMLALLTIAYGPWDRATHTRMAKTLVVIVAIVAGYAVLRWIIGPSDEEREFALAGGGAQYNFADGKLRVFGSFPNTRSLGVWSACVLPLCTALALHLRGRWRIVAVTAGCLAFAALIASGMRGGIPAAGLGCLLVMLVMTYTRAGRGLRLGVLGAVALALTTAFAVVAIVSPDPAVSERSYARILNPQTDPAYQERLYKWSAAWREADQHPFGQGLGTAGRSAVVSQRFVSIGLYDVDNSYLKVALDQGLFGLVLFVAALLALGVGLIRRSLRALDRQQAALGAAGAGTLAAFMVVMWTGNYVEGLPAFTAWLLVGLGLAQFATVPRERRSTSA